jgi:hypothetical protein
MRLRRSGPRLEMLCSIVLERDDVGGSLARCHYWAAALQGRKTSELGTGRAGGGKIRWSCCHGRTLDREASTDAPCQSWLGIDARSRRFHADTMQGPPIVHLAAGVISTSFTQNINRVRRAACKRTHAEPHWGGGCPERAPVAYDICPVSKGLPITTNSGFIVPPRTTSSRIRYDKAV